MKHSPNALEFVKLAIGALLAYRARSLLTALGIAVGIAAVVLLTSIGSGINEFVVAEFTQFGTRLVNITPGKTQTHGVSVGTFGTTRPLTLDDAAALEQVTQVTAVVPLVTGNAEIEGNGKQRRTTLYGVGPALPRVFQLQVNAGRFLPNDDPAAPRTFAVLGSTLRKELFGNSDFLGKIISVGGNRFRIIGSMEPRGQILGFDMDDTVFIPAARALEIYNREGLMEIDVLYRDNASLKQVVAGIKNVLSSRHGDDDFTITTQQQMLDVLGSTLKVLTAAVGALGGISLVVGAIGILTIMTIAVRERVSEIGVLRALGATHQQVLSLFLIEAIALAMLGGLAGLVIGVGGGQLLHFFVPALPVHTPWLYIFLALGLSAIIGLLAGVWPASHAARLNPVEALRSE